MRQQEAYLVVKRAKEFVEAVSGYYGSIPALLTDLQNLEAFLQNPPVVFGEAEKAPKVGTQRRRCKCSSCGEKADCEYGPNPYQHDVNGDDTPVWMCEPCRQQSADDI